MRIQHNITAMNSYRTYSNNTSRVSKNLEKLSSGYKINRAGDDAAGLAISEKMRVQITGLEQAQQNAKSGISLVQTAEGALTEVHDMLNRMYTLSEQSANGTYSNELDREQLQKEVDSLRTEINRIADSTNYNGINLLDGSLGGGAISSTETTLLGANISDFSNATATGLALVDTSGVTACKDTFIVDGQELTIDWNKGEAAKVLAKFQDDLSGKDQEDLAPYADELTKLFNDEMAAQGLTGEVKISVDGDKKFSIESLNESESGKVGFAGTDNATIANSLGNTLFGKDTAGTANVVEAGKTVGTAFTASDTFNMTINGTTVQVTMGAFAKDGTLDTLKGVVQTSIQAAVGAYNTAMGYTGTAKELTATKFTVEADPSGGLKVVYDDGGDENKAATFSFSESSATATGKPGKTAALLGLADASSISGGARGLKLQIGDTADSFNKMTVSINDMHARAMGIGGIDISTQEGASAAMKAIKSAVNYVSDVRGDLGALQNRLDHTINNLSVAQENIQDAESVIRDTDVAKEMMNYTKNNILVQSAQAMLAQANQLPQGVLQLLQ